MDLGTDNDFQSYEDEQLVVRMTEIAAAERQQQVQWMLTKQLDTGGSVEEHIQQKKSFIKGSTVKSIADHTKGQLSLSEFLCVQKEHQTVDNLRDFGLTDSEIAFKLQQDGKVPTIIQPAKRSNLSVDPSAQSKRLKAVNNQIAQQQEDHPGTSRHGDSGAESSDINQPCQTRKGIFSQLSLSRRFTHPDDPINHLHALEAEVFKKLSNKASVYQGCEPKPTEDKKEQDVDGLANSKAKERDDGVAGIWHPSASETSLTCYSKLLMDKAVCTKLQDSHIEILDDKWKEEKYVETNTSDKLASTVRADVSDLKSVKTDGQTLHTKNSPSQHLPLMRVESEKATLLQANKPVRKLHGQVSAISIDDIKRNRLTEDEIRKLDRFANYTPGVPSKVLYLKNLPKQVTEEVLVSLVIHFQTIEKPKLVFKLLTGRMRGQAFITFPDIETASSAMELVNGYKLNGKPVIVQFGRQPQK